MKEYVLTADYYQSNELAFVTKIYVKAVGSKKVYTTHSIGDLFRCFKNARFTVYCLKYFARFLFDYFENSGKSFQSGYNALITDTGDVFNIYSDGLQFVSYSRRTCLAEDWDKIVFDNKADIPSLIESHLKTLNEMDNVLQILFDMGLKKPTFSSNIKSQFCEGDRRRREYLFPQLSAYAFDVCSDSYKGGRMHIASHIRGDSLHQSITEYDIVSAYPYYMRDYPLPYGEPTRFEGKYTTDVRRPLYIQKLRAEIKLKNGCIPSLLLKDNPIFGKIRYVQDTNGLCLTFAVTNVELENILEYYEFEKVEYLGGYSFRSAKGLFDNYLDHWFTIKERSARGSYARHFAKHMLDNIGGFLGTKNSFINLQPYLDDQKRIQFKRLPVSCGNNKYCPAIAFVTAMLRNVVNDIIQYTDVLYTATDSFHVFDSDLKTASFIQNFFPLGDRMGNIQAVRHYDYAKYMGSNFYLAHEAESDTMRVVASGVPRKYKQSIANLEPNTKIDVPGFISIEPHPGGAYLKKMTKQYTF